MDVAWPSSDWIIVFNNVCEKKLCVRKRERSIFHSYHYQLAISARQESHNNAIIIKTATNYLNWIKRQQYFFLQAFSFSLHHTRSLARPVESNMRGLFIIVYGHSTSDCDATHVFTQGEEEAKRRKKKTEQTPCSTLMTIHVKLQTVGNSEPNHSQEMNSWIKDGCAQWISSCLHRFTRARPTRELSLCKSLELATRGHRS